MGEKEGRHGARGMGHEGKGLARVVKMGMDHNVMLGVRAANRTRAQTYGDAIVTLHEFHGHVVYHCRYGY